MTVVVPFGSNIVPLVIIPFTIVAFVTVVLPRFEFIIVEPVPRTVTLVRVEPLT